MSGTSLGGAALRFPLSASPRAAVRPQRMRMVRAGIAAWSGAVAQVVMAVREATGDMCTRPLASTRAT